jgi:hypothetical protein
VSGAFAAQIDTLGGAQQVDALTNRQLHRLEQLFAARQRASRAAGHMAGETAYGKQLDKANDHLHDMQQHLRSMDRELRHLKAEQAKHAKRTGDAVGDKINGATAKANRRVRNR